MAVAPVSPKIPPELEVWDGELEPELEIDRAWVKGQDFTGAIKINADASKVENTSITGVALDKLELTDVECVRIEGAAVRAYKANLLRVTMADCRLTGAEFAETQFEDCTFKNVKLDEVGFRFASFKRVRFEDCMLRQADFSSAKLAHVTFSGCDLEGTNFVGASCSDVDISDEDVTKAKGILGLKGATISETQLMQLAPLLASELGFHVKEDS